MNNGETIAIKVGETYFDISTDGEVKGEIEVTLDSTPGVIDGTGTVTDPFVIMSIEDLVLLSKQVNEGTNYSGKYVELGKTLDFNSDLSYIDPNTTNYDIYLGGDGTKGLKEQLTRGGGFMPIGKDENARYFQGMFDGAENTIKNIYINKEANNVGLFGYLCQSVIIQNLNITGKIEGLQKVGGIVGYTYNGGLKVINCNNYANVNGTSNVGGIIGYVDGANKATIKNCNNYGTIKATETTSQSVGGIVGVNGIINRCTNYGDVYGAKIVAGVCGNANSAQIFECVNVGKIEGIEEVGGIYGNSINVGLAERCYNLGGVIGQKNVGGIAGVIMREGYIKCAYNIGDVNGKENVGGIVGNSSETYSRGPISSKSYNIGNVTGTTNVGHAIGKLDTGTFKYFEGIYYLNTSSSKGIGNLDDIEGVVEGKTANELKQESFLTLLNATHTHTVDGTDVDYTSNCWVADTQNINSGYPIFSYQSPNSEE